MRNAVILLFLFSVAVLISAPQTHALQFTGTVTGGPSLSPVFGTLINFDDKPTGTAVLPNDYVSLGIASIRETEGLGFFGRYAGAQSFPNYVGTGLNGERGTDHLLGWDGTILVELSGLASQVGVGIAAGIADSDSDPEFIYAYDSSMNLLESYEVPEGLGVYTGIVRPSADIRYFKISGDFFAIDDLQHNAQPNAVPEPATMLLLGSGLIGLAGFARGKFRK